MFAIFGDKGGEGIHCFCNYMKSSYKETFFSSMPSKFPIHFSWPLGDGLIIWSPLCLLKKITCVYFSVKGVVVSCTLFLDLLGFWWDIKRTIFMVKLSISFKKFSFHTWNTILLHGQKSSPLTLYHTEKWSLFSHSICFFPDFILIFVMPFFFFNQN